MAVGSVGGTKALGGAVNCGMDGGGGGACCCCCGCCCCCVGCGCEADGLGVSTGDRTLLV